METTDIQIANIQALESAFDYAEDELHWWTEELEFHGYDANVAVIAAQYWGQLCALASAQYVVNGDAGLLARLNSIDVKLYKNDYEGEP